MSGAVAARAPRAPAPAVELAGAYAIAWLLLLAIPLGLGGIGLSWDALNHHFYLGWVADSPRFDRDFLAAAYQSYQFPYLYWPAYKLAQAGASGAVAGAVLVSLHALVAPALWILARACISDAGWYGCAMRVAAVVLGISGHLFLSLMDTTSNDGLAAVPFVWAAALALLACDPAPRPAWLTVPRCIAASGLLAGAAVAAKFSNGPLALLMPLLWCMAAADWRGRVLQVLRGGLWTLTGFALTYGYWGWQLWRNLGNPIFPFQDHWFAPLRILLGWQP